METNEYIIHITSGRGPAECCWVVSKVLSKIIEEAKRAGLAHEVLNREKGTEKGTLLSAVLKINGDTAGHLVQKWQGTIQWIGQSPYRKFHKRKNWYVGVEYDKASSVQTFSLKDVTYQAMRSGGPGGQHVNKVSTAVRAIHAPTGYVVTASDTRSQFQNKKLAAQRLKVLCKQKESELFIQKQQEVWNDHHTLIRGNPKRIFKGKDFVEVCQR